MCIIITTKLLKGDGIMLQTCNKVQFWAIFVDFFFQTGSHSSYGLFFLLIFGGDPEDVSSATALSMLWPGFATEFWKKTSSVSF